MPLALNSANVLQVSEGGATADEATANAGAFYDAAVQTAFNNLQSQGYTFPSKLATPQTALDKGLFNIAANTKDLMFSSAASHTAFSTTVGVDSGLTTIDGHKVWLFAVLGEDDIVVGRVGTDATSAANGSVAFAVALDEKVSSVDGYITDAQLWIRQFAPLTHADGTKVEDLDVRTLTNKLFVSSVESVQGTVSGFSTANSGNAIYTLQDGPENVNVLVTALKSDNPATGPREDYAAEKVNIATTGFGVANQGVDPGEGLRFDYVFGGTIGGGTNAGNINYSEHAELFNAGFGVVKFNGNATTANVKMTVQDAVPPGEDATNFIGDLGHMVGGLTIEAVRIMDASGALVYSGGNTPGAVQGMTVTGVGTSSVTVNGLQLNWTAEVVNKTKAFDRLIVENVGTSSFDIGKLITTTPPTISTTSVELGSKIQIWDGGPSISSPTAALQFAMADGGSNQGISGSIPQVTSPDGVASLTHSLEFNDSSTGLTSGGTALVLWKDSSGVIHGGTAANDASSDVFTVSVNSATGQTNVRMLSGKAIDHASNSDTATLNGKIVMKATAVDRDGDSATTTGQPINISFSDATPTIGAAATISLESTDGSSATDTKAFAFSGESYGHDGAGTTTTALEIINANTGLTSGGTPISLSMSGNDIVGKAGSATIFTVSLDGSNVKLTQSGAIDNGSADSTLNGALKITRTVTDKDGDTKSASEAVNLTFKDVGPTATAGSQVTLEVTDSNTAQGTSSQDNETASFTTNGGADGAASTTYSLSLNDTSTTLTSEGHPVALKMFGAGVAGYDTVTNQNLFVVQVDADGKVLISNLGHLDHPGAGADALSLSGKINVNATISDKDGSTATASNDVKITFTDTLPTITAGDPVALSSTDGSSATSSATASFTATPGADAPAGAMTYSLDTVLGGSGLTSGGQPINLSLGGGKVIGTTPGGTVVFHVGVDSSGVTTLTQLKAIDNPNGADAVLSGKISVVGTKTDGDGDKASATDAVTLTFKDAGPSITAGSAVSLETTDGSSTIDSEAFSFTGENYGGDGAGTTATVLEIINPTSGLKSGGVAINLETASDGSVIGKAGSTTVFTVSVDGSNLKLAQSAPIDHLGDSASVIGLLKLTRTVTDADGTKASASNEVNLTFKDGVPTITAGATVTLETSDATLGSDSETATFTSDLGPDVGGSTTYSLDAVLGDSGLKSGGNAISLSKDADGNVVGSADGAQVFKVSLASNGTVTLAQSKAIDHETDPTISLSGRISVVGTITDKDGDIATAKDAVTLTFGDSTPTITAGSAVVLESTDGSTTTDSKAFSFSGESMGADAGGATATALVIAGDGTTALKSGGEDIKLEMSGNDVVGMAGTTKVFTISLSGSNVVLDQDAPVDNATADAILNGAISIKRTVTDGDGDTTSASNALNLTFKDTNPTITAGSAVSLESTDGSSATDSKAFSFSGESYGGDGAGTTTTALVINGDGTTTLKSGGKDVTLETSGGSIVGKADGAVVFTVALSGNNVTLSQSKPLDNATADAVLNGAISIKRTVTDGDGDTTSASNAVNLTFKDVDPTATSGGAMSLTTSDATLGTDATANSGITHTLGADGGSFAYSLQGSGATTLTAGGKAISLAVVDGKVVGQVAGGGTAFTVSVDSKGQVTLDQTRAIDHAPGADTISLNGAISLVGTATDGDGDKASANQAVNLTFGDDKATIALSGKSAGMLSTSDGKLNVASASVSFVEAFAAANYGADGAGSTAFTFEVKNAASGLTTVGGTAVTLTTANDGTTLVGMAGANKAFEVTLDASGNAVMTQFIAIKHTSAAATEQSLAAGSVSMKATATDSDKDAASASVDVSGSIKVLDVTSKFVGLDNMVGSVDAATGAGAVRYVFGAKHTDTFSVDWQNDAPGVVSIASFDAYTANGLTGLKGAQVGNTLYYNYTTSLDPTVKPVFTVAVTDHSYTVEMVNAPKGLPQMIAFDKLPSGSPTEKVTANLTGSYGGSVTIDGLVFDQKSTATTPWSMLDTKKNGATSTDDDINTNNIGFGIKGGQASQINPGEGFQLVYNPPAGGGASTGGIDHLSKLSFDVYGVGNITGVKASYWLYLNGADGKAGTNDDILVDTGVVATSGSLTDGKAHNVVLKDDGAGTGQHGGIFDSAVLRFDFDGAVDKKTGLVDQNQGVRVGTFYTEITHSPDPDSFGFTLQATDVDGDVMQQLVTVGLHATDGWMV